MTNGPWNVTSGRWLAWRDIRESVRDMRSPALVAESRSTFADATMWDHSADVVAARLHAASCGACVAVRV